MAATAPPALPLAVFLPTAVVVLLAFAARDVGLGLAGEDVVVNGEVLTHLFAVADVSAISLWQDGNGLTLLLADGSKRPFQTGPNLRTTWGKEQIPLVQARMEEALGPLGIAVFNRAAAGALLAPTPHPLAPKVRRRWKVRPPTRGAWIAIGVLSLAVALLLVF